MSKPLAGTLILIRVIFFLKRLVIGSFLFAFFLSACSLESQELNVEIRAQSAILYNPKNGAILYQKEPFKPHPPSSTMKLAAALYILESQKLDRDHVYTCSEDAIKMISADIKQADFALFPSYRLEYDAVIMNLSIGQKLSVDALLHGALMFSACDATNVLAQVHSGSIETFMGELNAFIKEKGALQTTLTNPNGLHHPDQLTTAYDLAILASCALENEEIAKILMTPSYLYGNGKIIKNTNPLLKGKYHYPKCIGGKTGYVQASGHNIVAGAQNQDRRLIAVLFGYKNKQTRSEDTIKLFEAAFAQEKRERVLFAKEDALFTKPLGDERQVVGYLHEDVKVITYPAEEGALEAKIVWHPLKLPIKINDPIGSLIVWQEDVIITNATIYAKEPLKKMGSFYWIYFAAAALLIFFFGKKLIKARKRLR